MSRSARQKISLAAVLIDVDHFKRVHDTHGHMVGDDCLQEISKNWQQRHVARLIWWLGMVVKNSVWCCLKQTVQARWL